MTSLLLLVKLLFNALSLLHDEPFLLVYCIATSLNTPCARNIVNIARARRRMHLSIDTRRTTTTWSTMHLLCLLWLSWATQQVYSWAWGPYNDDWKRHIAPQNAANMYRVVLPRSNSTASSAFFSTGNSTTPGSNGTATGTGTVPLSTWTPPTYTNTTNSSTTTTIDTTCGVSSPLYTLQISGADGYTFNEWWLKLSGNSLLFTSQKEKATSFGVNSDTKHLCIPRSSATASRAGKLPLIAILETRLDQGPLYFLDANRTANYEPDYEPIECDSLEDGGVLSCSWDSANIWSGCGLQLELGAGDTTDGTLNCSSITLNAFGT